MVVLQGMPNFGSLIMVKTRIITTIVTPSPVLFAIMLNPAKLRTISSINAVSTPPCLHVYESSTCKNNTKTSHFRANWCRYRDHSRLKWTILTILCRENWSKFGYYLKTAISKVSRCSCRYVAQQLHDNHTQPMHFTYMGRCWGLLHPILIDCVNSFGMDEFI